MTFSRLFRFCKCLHAYKAEWTEVNLSWSICLDLIKKTDMRTGPKTPTLHDTNTKHTHSKPAYWSARTGLLAHHPLSSWHWQYCSVSRAHIYVWSGHFWTTDVYSLRLRSTTAAALGQSHRRVGESDSRGTHTAFAPGWNAFLLHCTFHHIRGMIGGPHQSDQLPCSARQPKPPTHHTHKHYGQTSADWKHAHNIWFTCRKLQFFGVRVSLPQILMF